MRIRFHSNRRLTLLLHLLAWTIIVILPHYLMTSYGNRSDHFLNQFYFNTAVYGSLFYFNYLWLVPRYFFRDNKIWYFLITTAIILFVCLILWYLNENVFFDKVRDQQFEKVMQELNKGKNLVKPPIKQFRLMGYFYTSVLIVGFSLGLGVMQRLAQNEKERKELEKEKLNSELAFLKNQISPHFFFNTLNNIYSLIGIDSEEAQEAVLKLSKLMRYLLYESDQGRSRLSDEVAFLHHYIDLMKLRLSDKVKLEVSLPKDCDELMVPPLLFVPFVENAFKHGVSYRERSFIRIRMEVKNTEILFEVQNSMTKQEHQDKDKQGGIGLENVKKRLRLLYPGRHELRIEEHSGEFVAQLKLETT